MKLASIEKLHTMATHPNADSLEKAMVLGWPVVVRKGEFKEGELVVFIFPDVLVDETNPYFEFMRSRKFMVWMAKFRKEPSCGLVCPVSILTHYGIDPASVIEGQDISETIKCVKYEKPFEATGGDAKGNFPTHLGISLTDEDNLLSNPGVLAQLRAQPAYITQKCDGSSGTILCHTGEIHVCSRRLEKTESEFDKWWAVCKKYLLPEKLKVWCGDAKVNLGVQFELVGPGCNGNRMGLKELDLRVFNVKDLDKFDGWTGWFDIKAFCADLAIPTVPLVKVIDDCGDLATLQALANEQKYDTGAKAEGIVIRPVKPVYSPELRKALSVKVLNQNYKE